MQLATALAVSALVSSVLLAGGRTRMLAIIAACVSGLEVAMAFGLVTLGISGFSVPLVLGAALAVLGALCFARNEAKTPVAASTVVAMVGVIQVLGALRLLQ